jgi:hypothetical protein
MREKIIALYSKGKSISEIAKLLNTTPQRVWYYLNSNPKGRNKKTWQEEYYEQLQKHGLVSLLSDLLTYYEEQKGERKTLSYAEIKRRLEVELAIRGIPSLSKTRWYQFLRYFALKQFGGWENLQKIRKGRKYTPPQRGMLIREYGVLELDITGYQLGGKNYSIAILWDTGIGYVFKAAIVENKEKGAKHYNKAFTSLDIAYWLQETFIEYGVPKALKSDNEKILKSRYLKNALKQLGVKLLRSQPGVARQKVVERIIGILKERSLRGSQNVEQRIEETIKRWNLEPHRFKHLSEEIIPAEHFKGYNQEIPIEEIENAFAYPVETTLRNNTIRIGELKATYQIYYPENLRVLVYVKLSDTSKAEVYNATTGEYIGTALRVDKPVSTILPEEVQKNKAAKRAERRKRKLQRELVQIQNQLLEEEEMQTFEVEILEKLSATENSHQPFEEKETTDFGNISLLDILAGGEENG